MLDYRVVRFFRFSLVVVLLLTLSVLRLPAAAQEPESRTFDRDATGVAPEREPVILGRIPVSALEEQVVVELPAVADTYIASGEPDRNFGNSLGLFLGFTVEYGAARPLLRFDLDPVPSFARVEGATLWLYLAEANPLNDLPMETTVVDLIEPWQENTVVWGEDAGPEWGPFRSEAEVGNEAGWYQWDVTDLVVAWVAGEQPNYGLEILGEEIPGRERIFFSREAAGEFYPRLNVTYTEPTVVTVNPLPLFSPQEFTVSWNVPEEALPAIAYYDVQYRVDGGAWLDWLTEVPAEQTSAQFIGEHGRLYEFRARGVDQEGNPEPFGDAEAGTTVDAVPPVSQVTPLPPTTATPSFPVSWSGTDDGSGIRCYDIQYRVDQGPWALWLQCTLLTSATFVTPGDGHYEFEARAQDNVGNVEPFTNVPEAGTVVTAHQPLEIRVWLPIIHR
jgi:hypothetical protein